MGFPRQEYWSILPCPPPRDLPKPNLVQRDKRGGKGKEQKWDRREGKEKGRERRKKKGNRKIGKKKDEKT